MKKVKWKPDLTYNIVGTSSAWDCVERCFKKHQFARSRATKKTLKGAVDNLILWANELGKSVRRRGL